MLVALSTSFQREFRGINLLQFWGLDEIDMLTSQAHTNRAVLPRFTTWIHDGLSEKKTKTKKHDA